MGRKRSSSTSGLAALLILCVSSFVLFTLYVREGDSGPLHTVQLGAAEVLRPARSVIFSVKRPFEAAGSAIGNAFDESRAEESLRRREIENQELSAQASRLQRENDRLRELLEGERVAYEYAPLARVVAPVGGQFTKRVVIDVGTEDGVKPEQAVVVGNNTLVGRTTSRVTANTAEVMLVTDQNFAAGARIVPSDTFDPSSGETTTPETTALETTAEATTENTEEPPPGEGLVRTALEGYLAVDYVDVGARVERGDYVVTSGRAGEWRLLFPPGLLVGTVESVSSQDIDQYKNIVVTPSVQPEEIEEVRVITDW